MKNLILTITLIFSSILTFGQNGITITVTVNNVANNEGVVAMALHSENTFMKAPSSDLRYHHQRYIHRSFSDYL